jgi:hypothetical protein
VLQLDHVDEEHLMPLRRWSRFSPWASLVARARHLNLFWLIVLPLLALTGMTLLMQALGIVSWDAPAHLYKVALERQYKTVFWDNNWYGGAYQIISYGFVFYWLARFISYDVLVVVSTGLMPLFYYLYMRKVYGTTSYWPTIALAVVLLAYMSNGQDPFLFAMSLMLMGMVLLVYGRPLLAVVPAGLAIFANPVGLVIGAVFLLADFIARPEVRGRYYRFALYLLPFVVARLIIAVLFYEKSTYMYPLAEIIHFGGFGMLGFVLARASFDPQRRAKQVLYLTFAAVALLVAVVPGNPIGWNVGRFFFLFGLPLLLDLRRVYLPKMLIVPLIAGCAIGQVASPVSHFFRVADMPSTRAAFFTPALRFAARHYDPNYRYHVVALDTHWEAYYFSINGFPITRGWFRQDDAVHNQVLSDNFSASQYEQWLRSMAVDYVFLPRAPLDWSGAREAQIITRSPDFARVFKNAQWSIYKLADPQPLEISLDGGAPADVLVLQHESVSLHVPVPGRYLVRLTYSPFWQLDAGAGTLQQGAGDFVELNALNAGYYDVRVNVTVAASLRQLAHAF